MPADGGLVAGVDGGGSKTTTLLVDEQGNLLGRGNAGASNFQSTGLEDAQSAIRLSIQRAFESAGLPCRPLAALGIGLAGVYRPEQAGWIYDWVHSNQIADRVTAVNDGSLLLWAGTPQGWGIGLISGTGSIAFGATPQGAQATTGGWGYLIGDEGSGYALGLAALRAVTQAADGRIPPTLLTARILAHFNLTHAVDLIPCVYQKEVRPKEIACLAPLVTAAAEEGDKISQQLLAQTAQDLASLVRALAHQLGFSAEIPAAFGGGLLIHNAGLVQAVIHAAALQGVSLSPVKLVEEPAAGAVRLALRLLEGL